MIKLIKKMIPKKIKEYLKPFKEKYFDKPKKKKLVWVMQNKHQKILQKIKGKNKIKVVFLSFLESLWKVESLYRKMEADPLFEPVVFVCPVTVWGDERMVQEIKKTYQFHIDKGHKVINSYDLNTKKWMDVAEISPDIIFTSNYSELTKTKYHSELFGRYLCCYIPYYFMATDHGVNLNNVYNNYFNISQWKIFWPHSVALNYSKRYSVDKGRNGLVFGYPAVEELVDIKNREVKDNVWKLQDKVKVIYAPHHTINNYKNNQNDLLISTFIEHGEYIRQLAIKYKDKVSWSFKPHPGLKHKLYMHPDWGIDKTNEYYSFWQSTEYTQLDDGEYIDLFLQSDAIIHDCSSFLVEYAFVNKPMMYLMNNNTEKLVNEFGLEFLKIYQKAYAEKDIESFVSKLADGFLISKLSSNWVDNHIDDFYKKTTPSEQIISFLKSELCLAK